MINMDERLSKRSEILLGLGLKFDGSYFIFKDETAYAAFEVSDLQFYDDYKFEREVNKVKEGLKDRGITKFGEEYDQKAYLKAKEEEYRVWSQSHGLD